MPVIMGKVINVLVHEGKEGKPDRRELQILETLGRRAELVNVSDMSGSQNGSVIREGQEIQLPVSSGYYFKNQGKEVELTYTFWGYGKNRAGESDQGAANGKAKANGPDAGAGAVRASI